jgi:hypothetical protein
MRPSSIIKHLIDYASSPIPPVNYNYVPRQPLHLQRNLLRSLGEDGSFLLAIYPLVNAATIGHHAYTYTKPYERDRTCYTLTGPWLDYLPQPLQHNAFQKLLPPHPAPGSMTAVNGHINHLRRLKSDAATILHTNESLHNWLSA